MEIGAWGQSAADKGIEAAIADARLAAEQGFASWGLPQIFGLDALTVLAIVGREVPGIGLTTGVVPTYPRHPWVMAQQARTVQQASGGRFTLGIGLSHQIVIEGMWGYSFANSLRHMREYLSVLVPLCNGEPVAFEGETTKAMGALAIECAPVPVVIAALGPKMLDLAGRVAAGTVTWCTGPRTLESHVVPTITKAAADAGRPAPRVIAALPVCVTDDPDGARTRAAQVFAVYGHLPSYQAMMEKEGVAGPADLAIVGTEAEVTARIRALEGIGVTEFVAAEFAGSADEAQRTRDAMRSLL